ncbi:hypothetical protein QE152_g19998 [Popillia japonica]
MQFEGECISWWGLFYKIFNPRWYGRWFPYKDGENDNNPIVNYSYLAPVEYNKNLEEDMITNPDKYDSAHQHHHHHHER